MAIIWIHYSSLAARASGDAAIMQSSYQSFNLSNVLDPCALAENLKTLQRFLHKWVSSQRFGFTPYASWYQLPASMLWV